MKHSTNVCRVLVSRLYDRHVRLPETEEEWEKETRGFIENYEFPCIGAWDGFHVYVSTMMKKYYSYKKRYTMTNTGLVGYNKRFLYAGIDAPGSAHDARLLRNKSVYQDIMNGGAIGGKMGVSLLISLHIYTERVRNFIRTLRTQVHTYMYVHKSIRTCTYTSPYVQNVHKSIRTQVRTCTYTSPYVHVRTQVHTYMYVHKSIRTCTYTSPYVHTYMYVHKSIRTCTYTSPYVHVRTQVHTYMYVHKSIRTCTYTSPYVHVRTQVHTYMYVHKSIRTCTYTSPYVHVRTQVHTYMYVHKPIRTIRTQVHTYISA